METKEIKKSVNAKKEKTESKPNGKMIIAIRIKGNVKVKPKIKETLYRLRLRRKYSAVIIDSSKKESMNMIKVVKHSVAYGNIEKETLIQLIEKRAVAINKNKIDSLKIAEELLLGKKPEEIGIKPFFRLHPPRGGIDSKIQFNEGGVLGDNKNEINKLVLRML